MRPLWALFWTLVLLASPIGQGRAAAADVPGAPARTAPPARLAGQAALLDAALSHDAPYVGEAVTYALRLFRSVPATGIRVEPPEFPDFDVASLPGQRDSEIDAGGRRHAVSEVAYRLTPLRPGQYALAPAKAVLQGVPGRTAPLAVAGPRLAVTVRPLPPHDGDAPFTGLVGRLELTSRLEPAAVAVGEEATYTVELAGQGNLAGAVLPPPPVPAGLDIRPLPAADDGQGPDETGKRTFRHALRPTRPGQYALPDMRLDVFDPEAGAYRTLVAQGPTLQATPAPAADPTLAPPLVQTATPLDAGPPSLALRTALALLPLAAFAAVVFPGRFRRRTPKRPRHDADPAAVAETLRRALKAAPDRDAPACRHALASLAVLDRMLYSGAPVDEAALGAAATTARDALGRLS